jgi:hypothetical protein
LAGDVLEVLNASIFKPSGITWRLRKCDQTKHFQAKWYHLAARKMRPNEAFSSQVESFGSPENTTHHAFMIRAAEHPARIIFIVLFKYIKLKQLPL